MRYKSLILVVIIGIAMFQLAGCSTIHKITEGSLEPKNIAKAPSEWPQMRKGMSKEEVISILGEPDSKMVIGQDEQVGAIEEWVYVGRYPGMPLDLGYVQKSRRLIFKGNFLTNVYREDDVQSQAGQ